MLIFAGISIENFMSFEKAELAIGETEALILGNNRDSAGADDNGAGKSTIAEALRWALYGETCRGAIDKSLTVDHVIRKGAKKASVTVEFIEGGCPYKVTRTRTKTVGSLTVEVGGNIHEGKSAQSVLDVALPISVVQFSNLVHLDGSYPFLFAPATDKDRKAILSDLVDVAIAAQMQEEAGKRLAPRKMNLDAVYRDYKQVEWEEQRYTEEMKKCQDRGQVNKQRLVPLKEQMEEWAEKVEQLEVRRAELDEKLAKLHDKRAEDSKEAAQELQKADDKIALLRNNLKDAEANCLEKEITEQEVALGELENEINIIEFSIAKKEELIAEGACPTCGQSTEAMDDDSLETLRKELKEARADYESIKKTLEELDRERDKQLESIRRDLEQWEAVRRQIERDLQDVLAETDGLVKTYSTKYGGVTTAWGEAKAELKNATTDWHYCKKAIAEAKADFEEAKAKLFKVKQKRTELDTDRDSLEAEVEDLEFWRKGFGPKGVPSLFIETVLPQISKRIQKYADILTGGDVRVELKAYRETKSKTVQEAIQISAVNSKGASVYGSNSTGERNRINLAVTLGLIEYFRDTGVFESNLLICDEIFDGLDATGVEQGIVAIREAQIPSVFVISHHDHFRPLFNETIYVRKENGVSSLEV